ncbi:MAG: CtsR family transcriptional regulator [Heliobacteriaceae bacterium]|nr:CtsR family transcriptional regulator [Heliobacteriaceae bacterium]MDD4588356.1 CtsR family transcriptional regulator [Heliobacteriaceae bacterium]
MSNLTDQIERYIKDLLLKSQASMIEIQRQQLAAVFGCVPSQINYVLAKRFGAEQGYIVESRRGGGGFVRIVKLTFDDDDALWDYLATQLGDMITEGQSERIIERLVEDEVVTAREGLLMQAAVRRDVLVVRPPQRDLLRARILKAMFFTLFRE